MTMFTLDFLERDGPTQQSQRNNSKKALSNIGSYDVICGRDAKAFNNVGNRRMRVLLTLYLSQYVEATERLEKSRIIDEVVGTIKSGGGRFLKWNKESSSYKELTDKQCHVKISHAFRDTVSARVTTTNKHQDAPMKQSKARSLVPIRVTKRRATSCPVMEHSNLVSAEGQTTFSPENTFPDMASMAPPVFHRAKSDSQLVCSPNHQNHSPAAKTLDASAVINGAGTALFDMFEADEEEERRLFQDLMDSDDSFNVSSEEV